MGNCLVDDIIQSPFESHFTLLLLFLFLYHFAFASVCLRTWVCVCALCAHWYCLQFCGSQKASVSKLIKLSWDEIFIGNCTQWIYTHNKGHCAVTFVRFLKEAWLMNGKEVFPNVLLIVEDIAEKLWTCRKESSTRRHSKAFCFHPHIQSNSARVVWILNKVELFTIAGVCCIHIVLGHRHITHDKREMKREKYLHWWSTFYFL